MTQQDRKEEKAYNIPERHGDMMTTITDEESPKKTKKSSENTTTHNILVMSGKGGVGKTTIAVNLAVALAEKGYATGLLDADIHGPNAPKMLGVDSNKLEVDNNGKLVPLQISENLSMVSMAFLLEKEQSVIWRGPMKDKLIKQFVEDVVWGNLAFRIVDLPPGTGDESLSIAQTLDEIAGAIIVSTPQQLSIIDAERSIDFCRKLNITIIGMIENMSGSIFGKDTIKDIAAEQQIPFLGTLPLDKSITDAAEQGKAFVTDAQGDSDTKDEQKTPAEEFMTIATTIQDYCEGYIEEVAPNSGTTETVQEKKEDAENKGETIFLPLLDNASTGSHISEHFGHAPFFGLYNTSTKELTITPNDLDHTDQNLSPIDQIVKAVNPTTIFAQGIGSKAINFIKEKGLKLKTGNYKTVQEVIDHLDELEDQTESCAH